ncbi:MAG TPA: glycosyltransferase [Tepidisphaeraceae bacterium]|jgi:glycosyltransferase involved in cell wall biosynthesis
MSAAPLISVIMSVYNGQEYLAEAMDSVLNQTFSDFEFVIIDDGSTDRSVAMLEAYAKKDSRIVFKARENRGLPATLNEGARMARGEYLARMDPDDVCRPERFAVQLAFMREHPDVACVGSRVTLIDPYGVPYNDSDHPLTHEEIDAMLTAGNGWAIVHPSAFMRKAALEKAGWYNEKYRTSQDFELWLRMAEIGRLANVPQHLVMYRQHLGSANFAKAEQQKRFKVEVLTAAYARRGLAPFDASVLPPAPITDPVEMRKRWGWAAIRGKRFAVARKHAYTNLRRHPLDTNAWKMLFCSVRGY